MLRWAERVFSPSGARAQRGRMERGDKKPRGRGLGRRNINGWRVLIELLFLKLLFSFLVLYCNFFSKPVLRCPRPRPRRLQSPRSATLHFVQQTRSALAQHKYLFLYGMFFVNPFFPSIIGWKRWF